MDKANNSMWNVAKIVHETVNAKDFKETFGTLENYATQIGMKKSNVSKLVKAYTSKMYLADSMGEKMPAFSTTQIVEMSPVEDMEKVEFIETYNIDENKTAREIREYAKAWKESAAAIEVEAEVVDAEDNAEVCETEKEDAMSDVMTVTYGGDIYQIIDPNAIKAILQIVTE
jgi:predicted HAD superfamily Cof-like phosphohydrolase